MKLIIDMRLEIPMTEEMLPQWQATTLEGAAANQQRWLNDDPDSFFDALYNESPTFTVTAQS